VRPLFDGFIPPPPYHWVSPPADFAAANQKPTSATDTITFDATGMSKLLRTGSDDAQIGLTFDVSIVPSVAGATGVAIEPAPIATRKGLTPVGFLALALALALAGAPLLYWRSRAARMEKQPARRPQTVPRRPPSSKGRR